MTDDEDAIIRRMCRDGAEIRDMAARLGRDPSTIRRRCADLGLNAGSSVMRGDVRVNPAKGEGIHEPWEAPDDGAYVQAVIACGGFRWGATG